MKNFSLGDLILFGALLLTIIISLYIAIATGQGWMIIVVGIAFIFLLVLIANHVYNRS